MYQKCFIDRCMISGLCSNASREALVLGTRYVSSLKSIDSAVVELLSFQVKLHVTCHAPIERLHVTSHVQVASGVQPGSSQMPSSMSR